MLLGAILALVFWFPHDIRGSFIETNQVGTSAPGDAFFPVLLAVLILILSAGLLASTFWRRADASVLGRVTASNLRFIGKLVLIVVVGLLLMRWLGPMLVLAQNALAETEASYRALSDTAPYKYVGFVGGGLFIGLALIRVASGAISMRSIGVVLMVLAALVLVLDGLLTNVQLPPNADL